LNLEARNALFSPKPSETRSFLQAGKTRALIFLLAILLSVLAVDKARAKTISIDGNFSDWEDVEKTVSGDLENYPFSGTTYYYNLSAGSWQTSDPGTDTCMANYDRSLEVADLWTTNDNNFLYFKIRRGADFRKYHWIRSGEPEWAYYSSSAASSYRDNPCAGKTIRTPVGFSHRMVFSFDKNQDGLFNYYLSFLISFPEGAAVSSQSGAPETDFYTSQASLYQDNGDGQFSLTDETLLTALGSGQYELSDILAADEGGYLQEIKVDLDEILSRFSLEKGNRVDIRYESASLYSHTTDNGENTLTATETVRLKTFAKARTKKTQVKIRGKTVKNGAVKITVNGVDQGNIRIGKKSEFKKTVSLEVGTNRLRIYVSHTNGTRSVSRNVTRIAKRAIDKPLWIDVIKAGKYHASRSSTKISGKIHGVSYATISINDEEWGRVMVKPKSGNYSTELPLAVGINVIKGLSPIP